MVLEHAGFRTMAANDLDSAAALLATTKFAVIVRDLNLAPRVSSYSLQQLEATAPELLRRTIVMTTAVAEQAVKAVRPGTVFAIVIKPFDIENLVNAVQACARASREADRPAVRRAVRRTPSSHPSQGSEPGTEVSVKLDSLQRFVMSVPALEQLLSIPADGQREAAIRTEMRRTLGALAATLTEASHVESSMARAAVFRSTSTVAGRLSTVPAPGTGLGPSGRDH